MKKHWNFVEGVGWVESKCIDCGGKVSRRDTVRCRSCANKHRSVGKGGVVPIDEQKRRRKIYKAKWAKRNRKKIYERKRDRISRDPELYRRRALNSTLKWMYGITIDDYDAMLEKQNGGCAICGHKPERTAKGVEKLCVDHCHKSMKIRGLLCMRCNTALGHFNEDLTFLKNAIEYLNNHETTCDSSENHRPPTHTGGGQHPSGDRVGVEVCRKT